MNENKKILVIEDEPEMRRNLATILRLENFQPLTAENGRVGLESVRTNKPDLILCDVMMPELDGYGVIAALRAEFSAEEATIARIFSQDKQREASLASDKVAMGRSRQHDTVQNNGSRSTRNGTGAKQR